MCIRDRTTSGATGYFVEYAGSAIRNLTMEGRLTLCNLSIEMGARGGMAVSYTHLEKRIKRKTEKKLPKKFGR